MSNRRYDIICENCKAEFQASRSDARFCGKKCYGFHRYSSQINSPVKELKKGGPVIKKELKTLAEPLVSIRDLNEAWNIMSQGDNLTSVNINNGEFVNIEEFYRKMQSEPVYVQTIIMEFYSDWDNNHNLAWWRPKKYYSQAGN